MPDPRTVYSTRLDQRRAEIAACRRRQRVLGYCRLACVAVALGIFAFALSTHTLSIVWMIVPMVIFTVLMVMHERQETIIKQRQRAERYFTRALARLDGEWSGSGESGQSYLDPAHPYAQDLDLFGNGSLFQLLCTARTHIGEDTLARWLLDPAGPETVRRRQQAVDELRPLIDLREDLAVVAEEARTGVDPISLAAWGESPALLESNRTWQLWMFTVCGLAGFVALAIMLAQMADIVSLSERAAPIPRDVLLIAVVINAAYLHRMRRSIVAVVGAVE